jgi:hypothetical protein
MINPYFMHLALTLLARQEIPHGTAVTVVAPSSEVSRSCVVDHVEFRPYRTEEQPGYSTVYIGSDEYRILYDSRGTGAWAPELVAVTKEQRLEERLALLEARVRQLEREFSAHVGQAN